MKIKIKKLHPDAVIPTYAKQGDAGMDLTSVSVSTKYNKDEEGFSTKSEKYIEYDTGLSMEIPEGFVGYLFPRSSVSKTDLLLANSVGVVDSGYRGPIKLRFRKSVCTAYPGIYSRGERVGQIIIMPVPSFEFEEVDELSDTDRGDGGFGSTGN
jgi:dUTP pyrophosphatase